MKTKLILCVLLLFAVTLTAQQRPRYGVQKFDADRTIAHLIEALNLTDEQVVEIKPILLQTQSKLKELRTKSYENNQEMRNDHRTVMEENAELIEEHLSDEQIEKFREMREQRPRFNRGDRPRMGRNR